MKDCIRLSTLLLVMLFLGACGWQLRGVDHSKPQNGAPRSATTPAQLHMIMWQRNSKMAQTLQGVIRSQNIQLTASAATTLVIEEESIDKRPLAVTDTGVTAQYQLILNVRYHYKTNSDAKDEKITLASRKLMSWRSYDFDAKLIVAKNQEEQALLQEMREELSLRILDSLPQ